MTVLAHFGKIPVEEWLPFVAPLVALYVFGRRRERRRRAAVGRLPEARTLSDDAIRAVEASWAQAGHEKLAARHLPLLYPPGPDGFTTIELAQRIRASPASVAVLLEELEELDYLTLDDGEVPERRPVSLTFRGYELLDTTEMALLQALEQPSTI